MATCRGRRSASGSEVTLMLIPRRSLSRGVFERVLDDERARNQPRASSGTVAAGFEPRQGIGQRQERPGLLHGEGACRRAPEALAVRIAKARDEAPHVRARRALDLEFGPVVVAPELLEAVNADLSLGHLQLLPPPRALVGTDAAHLHRRVRRG